MRVVLGFFLCIFALAGFVTTDVSAAETGWSVDGSSPVPEFVWTPNCPSFYQEIDVFGVGEVSVCQFGGVSPRLGISYPDNGSITLVVSYPLESKSYRLNGVCQGIANCVYAPSTDTLVSRYYSGTGLSTHVYQHVSERIHRVVEPPMMNIRYEFDASNPEFSFVNSEGVPLLVESLAVSRNGQWLALEYRNVGIIRINLKTFETKRIWAQGFQYGFGFDPTIEMAISNDGETLAVMGERSGLSVTTITPECGDLVRPQMRNVFDSPDRQCPMTWIDFYQYVSQFHAAYDPYFNESGDRLHFLVVSQSGEAVSLSAVKRGALSVTRLQYLALGDSFTSGEGETDDDYYFSGTNDQFEKCHVSSRSYPFLFAQLKGILNPKNMACSGAKISDISRRVEDYWGQGERLGVAGLHLLKSSLTQVQTDALDNFRSGRVTQDRFVEQYSPEIVTIGIGGNDAGLMTKLRTCLSPGICEWVDDIHRTAEEIQALFDKLVTLYQGLVSLTPGSHFYAVGYPQSIKSDGVCDPITSVLLQYEERQFMEQAITYLNEVIKAAAGRAHIGYYDVTRALEGHELCSGASETAVNGLRAGDDSSPGTLLSFKLIGNESFHPTPYGHALIANALMAQNTFHSSDDNAAPIPAYWGSKHSDTRLIAEDFVSPTNLSSDNTEISIRLPEGSLTPGSYVRIEVHSDVIEIGELISDMNGGVDDVLQIPLDTKEGLHTIHAFATSYSGEEIELYQEIYYKKQQFAPAAPISKAEGSVLQQVSIKDHQEQAVLGQTIAKQALDAGRVGLSPQIINRAVLDKTLLAAAMSICALGAIVLVVCAWRKFRVPDDG